MNTKSIILALAIGASSSNIIAQDAPPPRPPGGDRPQGDRPGQGRPGDPGRPGFRPAPPLMEALDMNKDGTIDADELAKATESLKKLDKNGDGKITEEELRPMRPPGSPDGRPPGDRGEGRPPGEPRGDQRPARPQPAR